MEEKSKDIYKNNFTEYLLCLALDIGEGMLKNGAEISRVEDTIERICRAYGAEHVECFTIISMISTAIRMPSGEYSTQMRRVKSTATNLATLESLNALSREICKNVPPLSEVERRIAEIKGTRPYPEWVRLCAMALAASAFCVFFGGGVMDTLITLLIGAVLFFIDSYTSPRMNGMVKILFSSFVAAGIATLSVHLGIGQNETAITIGAIMLLVPGLAFSTAMRDLLSGDLLAGSLKMIQACLCALMIAFGYMAAVSLIGGILV